MCPFQAAMLSQRKPKKNYRSLLTSKRKSVIVKHIHGKIVQVLEWKLSYYYRPGFKYYFEPTRIYLRVKCLWKISRVYARARALTHRLYSIHVRVKCLWKISYCNTLIRAGGAINWKFSRHFMGLKFSKNLFTLDPCTEILSWKNNPVIQICGFLVQPNPWHLHLFKTNPHVIMRANQHGDDTNTVWLTSR